MASSDSECSRSVRAAADARAEVEAELRLFAAEAAVEAFKAGIPEAEVGSVAAQAVEVRRLQCAVAGEEAVARRPSYFYAETHNNVRGVCVS